LVLEDKRFENPEDPKPHLIAEAIAAYHRNNFIRDGYSTSQFSVRLTKFPGITLVGTSPTFYKIKVTVELNGAVMGGNASCLCSRYTPRLPHRNSEGMKPLEKHYDHSVLS